MSAKAAAGATVGESKVPLEKELAARCTLPRAKVTVRRTR